MPTKNPAVKASSQKNKTPAKLATPKSEKPSTGWEWASFTKISHEFTRVARELATALKVAYGDNVSISQFEKLLMAVPSMTEAQRGLLYIDPNIVALFKAYRSARDLRDSERNTFRGDIQIGNVDTGLEALQTAGLLENNEEGVEAKAKGKNEESSSRRFN
jgi:hypothetical protein